MTGFHFDRARMAELLDCLNTGKPVTTTRSAFDYLMIAAAAQAAVFSQGPHALQALPSTHQEYREAAEEEFNEGVPRTINLFTGLAFKIMDGTYEHPDSFFGMLRMVDGKPQVTVFTSSES